MKKILLSSSPNGNFQTLLPKISQLHKKNNFNFMLITGCVCPSSSSKFFNELRQKKYEFPLPTYFIDSSDMGYVLSVLYPQGMEVCHNFWYLGNMGVREVEGVKVGFVSGFVQQQNRGIVDNGALKHQFSKKQVRNFIDSCIDTRIDILLTNQWCPQYIPVSSQLKSPSSNQTISQICYELSPRYHIASTGIKYLRLPAFRGKKNNATHFINVAQIVDSQTLPKDKYLVAIQMDPNVQEVIENLGDNILIKSAHWDLVQDEQAQGGIEQVQNVKKSGFLSQIKISKKQNQEQIKILDKTSFIMFQGFPEQTPNSQITEFLQKWGEISEIEVFKTLKKNKKAGIVRFKSLKDAQTCLKDSGKYTLYQSRIKFEIKQQNQKYRLKDCYLCIENQKFDKSLLAFKGKFCYISVDKGPVTENHFQIVPINHVSSTSELQMEQQQQISRYRLAYQLHFNKLGYTFVCIQRNMKLSAQINHSILHCIPLKHPQSEILQKFTKINQQNRLNFQPLNSQKPSKSSSSSPSPYFILLQINSHRFIRYTDAKDKKFQIGRQTVCEILQKPERLNWRDCEIGQNQVKKTVELLRQVAL